MKKSYRHITLCANDFSSGSSLYTWDANGNLVSDSGKGVVSVSYNRLNLPVAVDLGDRGDITFTYDGLGRKLSMASRPKLTINPLAKSTPKEINGGKIDGGKIDGGKIDGDFPVADIDFFSRFYYDNLIFKGTQLERILFPGGYITPSGTEYIYHYYVTDRQGNVRAVVRDGNLVEANDYYPYGMLMTDADGKIPDKQPYKLSGKEYITTRGLNLYDFGARMHDPAAMRFSTPDPLMEQYPSLSPYTYCAANPLKYIDPTGMVIVVNGSEDENEKMETVLNYFRENELYDTIMQTIDESLEIFTIIFKLIPPNLDNELTISLLDIYNRILTIDKGIFSEFNTYEPSQVYNAVAEELYHIYQELTPKEKSLSNFEFEAKVAALIAFPDVTGCAFADGIIDFKYYLYDLTTNKDYLSLSYFGYNDFTNRYLNYGSKFQNFYINKNTQLPGYTQPVNVVPKRLLNLIFKNNK